MFWFKEPEYFLLSPLTIFWTWDHLWNSQILIWNCQISDPSLADLIWNCQIWSETVRIGDKPGKSHKFSYYNIESIWCVHISHGDQELSFLKSKPGPVRVPYGYRRARRNFCARFERAKFSLAETVVSQSYVAHFISEILFCLKIWNPDSLF